MAAPDVEDQHRMSFWEHLDELRKRLKVIFISFVLLFAIFMTFSVAPIAVGSVEIPFLVPAFAANQAPVGAQLFEALLHDLVPTSVDGHAVNISAYNIVDGIIVEIKTAMFLAVALDSPLITYELAQFIGPGLKPSEKRLLLRMILPVAVLFAAGVILCFLVVLPFTYRLMFQYQAAVGVTFFQLYIDNFASFTLLFLLAFGVAFELPVVMYALSAVGIAGSGFWKKYWRYATAGIFIFGALITPDGSGVTMMLVSLPMLALYVLGYLTAVRAERHRTRGAKSS